MNNEKRAKEYFVMGYLRSKCIKVSLNDLIDWQIDGTETEEQLVQIANDYLSNCESEEAEAQHYRTTQQWNDIDEQESFDRELYG